LTDTGQKVKATLATSQPRFQFLGMRGKILMIYC